MLVKYTNTNLVGNTQQVIRMLGNQCSSKDEESLSLASIVLFLSNVPWRAFEPGMPPEQERNVALSGKQILLAGLTYYSCEASLACPLSVARLAWRACLACSVLAWRAL